MNPVVYIKIPTHIRQWAYHAYGNSHLLNRRVKPSRRLQTPRSFIRVLLIYLRIRSSRRAVGSLILMNISLSCSLTPRLNLCESTVISVLEQDVPSRRSSSTSSRWISGHRLRISLTDHAAYLPSFLHGASSMVLASIMRILCVNASTECVISTRKKALF